MSYPFKNMVPDAADEAKMRAEVDSDLLCAQVGFQIGDRVYRDHIEVSLRVEKFSREAIDIAAQTLVAAGWVVQYGNRSDAGPLEKDSVIMRVMSKDLYLDRAQRKVISAARKVSFMNAYVASLASIPLTILLAELGVPSGLLFAALICCLGGIWVLAFRKRARRRAELAAQMQAITAPSEPIREAFEPGALSPFGSPSIATPSDFSAQSRSSGRMGPGFFGPDSWY